MIDDKLRCAISKVRLMMIDKGVNLQGLNKKLGFHCNYTSRVVCFVKLWMDKIMKYLIILVIELLEDLCLIFINILL